MKSPASHLRHLVKPDDKIRLKDIDPDDTGPHKSKKEDPGPAYCRQEGPGATPGVAVRRE